MELKNTALALCGAACIGEVDEVYNIIKNNLKEEFKIVKTNEFGIIAANFNGSDKTLMLDAHIDEIGFVVTEILKGSFLRVAKIGGIDDKILPSARVRVFGKETVDGVFCSTPPHLSKKGDNILKADELFVDCGKNIENTVFVGDKVTFATDAFEIGDNCIAGKALDNRISAAALILCADKLFGKKCKYNVVLSFSKSEELGLRGAKTTAYDISPDEAIVIDTTFGNMPQIPPHKTGKVGCGPLIGISPTLSKSVTEKLKKSALNHRFQYEIMGGTTSTNADVISLTKSGIPTALLSIPIRSMHTPTEVASFDDIEAVADILTDYILEAVNVE